LSCRYKFGYSLALSDRPLVWLRSSLEDLRAFPAEVRRLAGYQLRRVESGLMPSDWKSMPSVGPGVHEIRLRTGRGHRVVYVARFGEAIYVLHAFEKKTRRTDQADLDLARRRYSELRVVRAQAREI
jgi:phage-related protein